MGLCVAAATLVAVTLAVVTVVAATVAALVAAYRTTQRQGTRLCGYSVLFVRENPRTAHMPLSHNFYLLRALSLCLSVSHTPIRVAFLTRSCMASNEVLRHSLLMQRAV